MKQNNQLQNGQFNKTTNYKTTNYKTTNEKETHNATNAKTTKVWKRQKSNITVKKVGGYISSKSNYDYKFNNLVEFKIFKLNAQSTDVSQKRFSIFFSWSNRNLPNLLLVETLIKSNERKKDSLIWINPCCFQLKSFHDSRVKLS